MPRNIYDEDHEAFRSSVREFVDRTLTPRAEEMLAPRMLSLHNLRYLHRLVERAAQAVRQGRYSEWALEWAERYFKGKAKTDEKNATPEWFIQAVTADL